MRPNFVYLPRKTSPLLSCWFGRHQRRQRTQSQVLPGLNQCR